MPNYRSNSEKFISVESPTCWQSELLPYAYGKAAKSLAYPFLTIGVFGEIYLGELSGKSRAGEAGSYRTDTNSPAAKQR
ncbi:hypothetical protein V498_02787 [Pseudogymnoascus sp. VKM F-4517 (FW-2822)]|nr:hypothetical protein V498_02787 [Pseudogymnoascus sp. VKM F-4517 (FW-2822)]